MNIPKDEQFSPSKVAASSFSIHKQYHDKRQYIKCLNSRLTAILICLFPSFACSLYLAAKDSFTSICRIHQNSPACRASTKIPLPTTQPWFQSPRTSLLLPIDSLSLVVPKPRDPMWLLVLRTTHRKPLRKCQPKFHHRKSFTLIQRVCPFENNPWLGEAQQRNLLDSVVFAGLFCNFVSFSVRLPSISSEIISIINMVTAFRMKKTFCTFHDHVNDNFDGSSNFPAFFSPRIHQFHQIPY